MRREKVYVLVYSLAVDSMVAIFSQYCKNTGMSLSVAEFVKNLSLKKSHPEFNIDMYALLPEELNWDFEEAYRFVLEKIIQGLP